MNDYARPLDAASLPFPSSLPPSLQPSSALAYQVMNNILSVRFNVRHQAGLSHL